MDIERKHPVEHPPENHSEHQPESKPEPSGKKDWYKKPWGILVAILFFPIFIIWYAWAKSKWSKNTKIGVTIAASALMLFSLAAQAGQSVNNNLYNGAPVVGGKPTTNKQTSSPAPAKTTPQPAKPQTMDDKLWAAVDASLKTRKDITVSYDASDPNDRVAFIEHTDPEPFDSQSFIRQSYTILALYGQEAFKIDGVDSINVQNKTNFTDQYGNKKLDSGVTIDMHKADFMKFNWKNLEYLPVGDQIQAASDVYIILPALEPYTAKQLYLTLQYP